MKFFAAMLMALGVMSSAQAAFLGRNALNQADPTCTVSGATKCVSFYNDTLDITILNNWSIGYGLYWDASASAGSAQAIAAAAGLAATRLSGWVLPTGDGNAAAGSSNQYKSIRQDVGLVAGSFDFAGKLFAQFDGVLTIPYWTGSEYSQSGKAWTFWAPWGLFGSAEVTTGGLYVVAVRPGDVANVPIPATLALLGLGLAGIGAARRKSA